MLYVLDKNVVIVLSINLATCLSGFFSMTNVCPESQWNSVIPVESKKIPSPHTTTFKKNVL